MAMKNQRKRLGHSRSMTVRTMPRPGVTPHVAPMTISTLVNDLKQFDPEKARREYPWASRFVMGLPLAPWQREFKWSDDHARRFIHSAWTGVHLGTYVVTDLELRREVDDFRGIEFLPLSNCVIDGQQRLMALELYLTDRLAVPDSEGTLTLWSEVDARDRRRFQNTIFSRGIIRERDETKLRELYDVMNFGGVPHLDSERAIPQPRLVKIMGQYVEDRDGEWAMKDASGNWVPAARPSTSALEQESLESFRESRSRSPIVDVVRAHLGIAEDELEDVERPRGC